MYQETVIRKNMKMINYNLTAEHTYFTSDTHFNHGEIISFCKRPFADVEEMNETLITNWNRVIGKRDVVFHLGDFSFGGAAEWKNVLDRLNGKIFLILGNHDMKHLSKEFNYRFVEVVMQKYIKIHKQAIYLNHYPFLCYGGAYKNVWQLFGHVHTSENNTGWDAGRLSMLFPLQYDVGVDNNNFAPVSFEQVRCIIEKQKTMTMNHEDNKNKEASLPDTLSNKDIRG